MGFGIKMIRLIIAGGCALSLAGCAGTSATIGNGMAAMPTWLGGEPSDVPPRPGSQGYQAWVEQHQEQAPTSSAPAPGNGSQPDWIGH